MLQAGIVGLPNVGKSTLFNALTKSRKAEAANYPFCTIDPNVGVVQVPDERLAPLAELAGTSTIIPAAIEMVVADGVNGKLPEVYPHVTVYDDAGTIAVYAGTITVNCQYCDWHCKRR